MKAFVIQSINKVTGQTGICQGKVFFDKKRAIEYIRESLSGISVNTENTNSSNRTILEVKTLGNTIKKFYITALDTEEIPGCVEELINKECFNISCLSREDLIEKGFDAKKITDKQMQRIADKLGDDYCEQLFWSSLKTIAEYEDCPVLFNHEEIIRKYIEEFGDDTGALEMIDGPDWTFYDDDNNGYTDTAVKIAKSDDGKINVCWNGERGKETWEELTDIPNDFDSNSFFDCLVECLENEFGEL